MESAASVKPGNRKARIGALLAASCSGLYERDEAVRLAFLAAAAGESVFMLGPPGVAKSLVARRLKHCFAGARSFEYLMGRFSTPEEVFGPISISKLKNEDKYERLVDAYLPGADVAFLDEIWKASPPIQNSLLTAINEKIFRNGEREIAMPLKVLVAASNELPPEGQGLEALWDRFLVRLFVDNISKEDAFRSMVLDSADAYAPSVSEASMVSAKEWQEWRSGIPAVELPVTVLDLLEQVRKGLRFRNDRLADSGSEGDEGKPPIYVSDRRWKKIVRLLKASAYLDGRDSVDVVDCLLIRHCIWSRNEEREECRVIVENAVRDQSYSGMYPVAVLREQVATLDTEVDEAMYEKKKFFVPQERDGYYWVRKDAQSAEQKAQRFSGLAIPAERIHEIKAGIFNSLPTNNVTLSARLRDDAQVEISFGNDIFLLPLEGSFEERKVPRGTPKPVDRINWDRSRNALHDELESVDEAIKKHRAAIGEIVEYHPFVPRGEAVLAYENLATMTGEIRKLEVDLDRIRTAYGG